MIVYLEKAFGWLLEKLSGRDELEEMSGLKKDMTGLPVNLWVDDSHAYTRRRHAKRIKFQGDYGNNANRGNMFYMTISKDNPQIPAKQLPKVRLPSKDIDAIKTFVRNNADLLDKLADEEIGIVTFLHKMKT